MPKRFTFMSSYDTLTGNLYLPSERPKGAVVLTGPLTSVKEQAAGAYAHALAERGYAALAFDHRHFGESEGVPRQYENPKQKIADIRSAVLALASELPGVPLFATGICAGAGYMAGAVAEEPAFVAFAGVAGFYHDAAQSQEWMGDAYQSAIEAGRTAREAFESGEEPAMIPAVAIEGDRAMPMDEAYAFYGTARGGQRTFRNYRNAFAIMSKEQTTPYDAQKAAALITCPVLMVHSENALSPMLARRFYDQIKSPKVSAWIESEGQIDFYDDPTRINPVTDRIVAFFDTLRT